MGKAIDETFLRMEFDTLWDGFADDQCYIVSLSQRDISVILSCLRFTAWPSRWFDDGTRLLRDVGRLSDLETALTYSENLKARIIMACNFDESLARIAAALESLPGAIAAASCCQGVGPGYVEDGEGGVWYGTQQPKPKPTTFGGEFDEFDTETEFDAHLCQAANNIVSGLIQSLNFWSALTLAGLVAGSLIVAFFIAAPPVAVFVTLGLAGFSFGVMATLSNYIDTNRQDWVCAIYNSTGYASMLVEVDTLISEMVIALDIGAFEVPLTDLVHAALSTDVFNTAYSAIGLPPVTDAVDCSVCEEVGCENFAYDFLAVSGGFAEQSPRCVDSLANSTNADAVHNIGQGLRLTATAASGTRIITAENLPTPVTIGATSAINLSYVNNVSVTTRISISLVTNLGCRYSYHDHGAGTFEHTYSLAAWEGEIIDKIQLSLSSNGGNPDVTFTELEFFCVTT
jgi:hypothetical protein